MLDSVMVRQFPASVVKLIDEYTLVINRGANDGVTLGDEFLVYYIDPEELVDPETGESLGNLEVVRGSAQATHVQAKMTTIKSNRFENKSGKIIRRSSSPFSAMSSALGMGTEIVETPSRDLVPFDSPQIGDKVKRY